MVENSFTFKKEERLKSKKVIEKLFESGRSILVYPVKLVYIDTEIPSTYPVQASFSVSKKNFKKAVQRNLIKRRMREAYRLNKNNFYTITEERQLAMMFIYIAREKLPYTNIESSIKQLLKRVSKK